MWIDINVDLDIYVDIDIYLDLDLDLSRCICHLLAGRVRRSCDVGFAGFLLTTLGTW